MKQLAFCAQGAIHSFIEQHYIGADGKSSPLLTFVILIVHNTEPTCDHCKNEWMLLIVHPGRKYNEHLICYFILDQNDIVVGVNPILWP